MLPVYLHKYFWDVDVKKVDKNKSKDYIIARILEYLEYGDIAALKWLFHNFSQRKIKAVFAKRRGFSKRTANFWRLFFNLPKNKVVCLNKSFLGKHESVLPY